MNLTGAQLIALLPILVLGGAIVLIMLAIAFWRHHGGVALLTLLGLLATAAMLPLADNVGAQQITPLLLVDRFALFFMGLILAASAVITVLAYRYFAAAAHPDKNKRALILEEFYLLLLLAVLGAIVLTCANHFASFFIGLELLSVALFALIAYPAHAPRPLEAAVKYLILAGVSSAFLLFGMAFIYAELGTMAFAAMGAQLGEAVYRAPVVLAGLALLVVGVGFKLSLVPFHLWTPDVYEGAPAPVAALLASVSKGAVFVLLLRFFVEADLYRYDGLLLVLAVLAILSMLVGNLLALLQTNIKRLLAYSSIGHVGFLLVALLVGGVLGVEAAGYYLVAYFVMTLGAFAVVSLLSTGPADERESVDDYRALFWRRPALAGVFTGMLLSLAGIPLTVGFIGKFYLFAAGVDAAQWLLVLALVAGSAIGLYYYLRVIVTMYRMPAHGSEPTLPGLGWGGGVLLATLSALLIWLGVFPAPLVALIQATALRLL